MNLQISLIDSLSPVILELLHWLSEQAGKNQVSIYIVGGFVRDLILHRPNTDFDIVVEGDAIKFAKSLSRIMGGKLVIHRTFGTAVWNIHSIQGNLLAKLGLNDIQNSVDLPKHIDFITARQETYPHPAALPVVNPDNIAADQGRRDFTINTLAIKMDKGHFGELVDPFNGYKDIKNGIIRVLHDKSFLDDPTRQLRAVRFEQRFGFHIEAHTLNLMQDAKEYLRTITGIRVRHEMDLMLKESNSQKMFSRAGDLGILAAIHPSLNWDGNLSEAYQKTSFLKWNSDWGIRPSFSRLEFKIGMDYCVWLSIYPTLIQRELAQRLSIPKAITGIANKAYSLREILPELKGKSISQVTFQLDEFPPVVSLVCLCLTEDEGIKRTIDQYLNEWRKIVPFSNGHDLRKLGLPAGSAYKSILRTLRAAWLDDEIHTKNEEQILLNELLHS